MCKRKNHIDRIRARIRRLADMGEVKNVAELYEDRDRVYDLVGVFLVGNDERNANVAFLFDIDHNGEMTEFRRIPGTRNMTDRNMVAAFDSPMATTRVLRW